MYYKKQTFFVAGLSRSGISAANFLRRRGAKVYLYDDDPEAYGREGVRALQAGGAACVEKEGLAEACEESNVLVLSPGVPIDGELPLRFRRAGKRIVGEAELGCMSLRAALVAVTGTNGKTTTVAMLDEIFRAAGEKTFVCGNSGSPVTSVAEEAGFDDIAVMEVSSFQLETLSSIRPHVAIVTNIAEDHLNRHYTMENYIFLKSKILQNMRESEFAVLNYDDPAVADMAAAARCPVRWFSLSEQVEGAYVQGGSIYYCGERVTDVSDLSLHGAHNVKNALAAVCAARLMGVEGEVIARALASVRGVHHRIETVGEKNGVTFIDDSKGTNVEAALTALSCMEKDTVLLLGGKDKGDDYDKLFASLRGSRAVHCVLYGENRFRLLDAAVRAGEPRITLCTGFAVAVRVAAMTARPGQCVLLSPACSSFDEFSGYEARGEKFAQIVESLPGDAVGCS